MKTPATTDFRLLTAESASNKEDEEIIFQRFGQGKNQSSSRGSGPRPEYCPGPVHPDRRHLRLLQKSDQRQHLLVYSKTWTGALTPHKTSNGQSYPGHSIDTKAISPDAGQKSDRELRTILIAEDNPTSQLVLEAILAPWISHAICATTDQRRNSFSQTITGRKYYAAIFMDCEMPVQDGFITTQAIRSTKSIPI